MAPSRATGRRTAPQRGRVALGATTPTQGGQTLILDGFPTPEQVRLLGPNGGMGNRYAVSTCRANVKARVKIEVDRQGIVPMAPPVRVTLRYVFSDARARDEDNFALVGKPVVDGLVKSDILAGDDGERLSERVRFATERGARRLEIILEPLAATDEGEVLE